MSDDLRPNVGKGACQLRTRLTELLDIRHPIIQAGATYMAVPRLVAAVSNAGGFGILASGRLTPEKMREDIRTIREQTDRPFGVNITQLFPEYEKLAEVAIEEGVIAVNHGAGNPSWLLKLAKGSGVKIIPSVGGLRHAVKAEQEGSDAIIVQGLEGGGHTSDVATTVLLPLVTSKVKIPVIAAGGFCDGRGLAAALMFGAEGVSMGTRFAVTQESGLPWNIKQRFLRSSERDTLVTGRIDGMPSRLLRNRLIDIMETVDRGDRVKAYEASLAALGNLSNSDHLLLKKALIEGWGDLFTANLLFPRALLEGDEDFGAMLCGQACGRIDDIPTAKELIERTVAEACTVLQSVSATVLWQHSAP